VDEVLPERPVRQWVLSVPYSLRYLFATNPAVMSVACKSHQRKKLERLCRYITRPAIAGRGLSLASKTGRAVPIEGLLNR